MKWTENLSKLNIAFANLYPDVDSSRRIVAIAGLEPALIAFSAASMQNWFAILLESERRNATQRLVEVAREEYPGYEWPNEDVLSGTHYVKLAPKDDFGTGMLEKLMTSQSTLLPISFLEQGLIASQAVGRVVTPSSRATGFLLSPTLMMTNNHVMPDQLLAQGSRFELNYQVSLAGNPSEVYTSQVLPEDNFFTSRILDCTVVGISRPSAPFSTLRLKKQDVKVGDFVNIVQHPEGGFKQIGLYHNTVMAVGEGRVQYLTDTLPGSSGSPVFNSQWEVVALHRSGGMLREPSTGKVYYRNEGVYINHIVEWLTGLSLLGL
jgi:hypothetical protein